MQPQGGDGVDRGPFGAVVEEGLEIFGKGRGGDDVPETTKRAAEEREGPAPGTEDPSLGEEDIDEAAH